MRGWGRRRLPGRGVRRVGADGVPLEEELLEAHGERVADAQHQQQGDHRAQRRNFLRGGGAVDPHSNRYWAQSNVTFDTAAALTALTVELRVARTGGVASTGHWRTPPAEHFTVSVREEPGAPVYTWTLGAGRTVPAGRHVFAGQYNHAEGDRDARGDRFTVIAVGADGRSATVTGDFPAGPAATGPS
ncbi:hypothetical protein [Streptomyces fradiae]|uniref:hypothetical protein n=1 Tax=Streptomyces fradiae TaxID=1906 RepID=UPI0035BE893C